jgi:hypothetical protein
LLLKARVSFLEANHVVEKSSLAAAKLRLTPGTATVNRSVQKGERTTLMVTGKFEGGELQRDGDKAFV